VENNEEKKEWGSNWNLLGTQGESDSGKAEDEGKERKHTFILPYLGSTLEAVNLGTQFVMSWLF